MVILIDASEITNTNIGSAKNNTPIFLDNLKVSIIAEGCTIQLNDKKITS